MHRDVGTCPSIVRLQNEPTKCRPSILKLVPPTLFPTTVPCNLVPLCSTSCPCNHPIWTEERWLIGLQISRSEMTWIWFSLISSWAFLGGIILSCPINEIGLCDWIHCKVSQRIELCTEWAGEELSIPSIQLITHWPVWLESSNSQWFTYQFLCIYLGQLPATTCPC